MEGGRGSSLASSPLSLTLPSGGDFLRSVGNVDLGWGLA